MNWRGFIARIPRAVRMRTASRRVVRSRGLTFSLQCDNPMTYFRWSSYNTKEPETLDWIDGSFRSGDIFLDIGANIGVYSIYAALRHPDCRVIAVEPEYANLHLLRDNIIANRLEKQVEVYSVGISDRIGISHLYLQDLTPGSALHTVSTAAMTYTLAGRPVIWQEGICALTLDAFCEGTVMQPNVIKIDVDGTEARILAGGTKTLSSPFLRSLLIEFPVGPEERAACDRLLTRADLHRWWRDPAGRSANELWTRDAVGETS